MHTRGELATDFRRIGLERGDAVVLHGSLRSIGRVDGGADTVVAALLDVLGPDGLLAAPVYTYWTQRFDPAADPGQTGRIAEAIRRWPGAVRSWHPSHSVAAIGDGRQRSAKGITSLARSVTAPRSTGSRRGAARFCSWASATS